jgi:hypothetical protein
VLFRFPNSPHPNLLYKKQTKKKKESKWKNELSAHSYFVHFNLTGQYFLKSTLLKRIQAKGEARTARRKGKMQ